MSAFSKCLPQVAEAVGFGLICVALWLVSPVLALAFAGAALLVAALIWERNR